MTIVPHREISRITKERWQRGSPPLPYSVKETKEIEGWGRKKQLFLYSTKPEGPEEQRERERGLQKCVTSNYVAVIMCSVIG